MKKKPMCSANKKERGRDRHISPPRLKLRAFWQRDVTICVIHSFRYVSGRATRMYMWCGDVLYVARLHPHLINVFPQARFPWLKRSGMVPRHMCHRRTRRIARRPRSCEYGYREDGCVKRWGVDYYRFDRPQRSMLCFEGCMAMCIASCVITRQAG